MLLVNASVRGRPTAIRTVGGAISEMADALQPSAGEEVYDAAGAGVLPGLHDHHLHLRAMAAARDSVDLSAVTCPSDLDRLILGAVRAVRTAPGDPAVRAVGWSEGTGGDLDRHRLDALAGAIPLRVQHRSGSLWVLNSAALAQVGARDRDDSLGQVGARYRDDSVGHGGAAAARATVDATTPSTTPAIARAAGIERDARGAATGRLWRSDAWLGDRLPRRSPSLAAVTDELAGYGITGVTDATPDQGAGAVAQLAEATRLRVCAMLAPGHDGTETGTDIVAAKLLLDDDGFPEPGKFADSIAAAHAVGRPVAIHCVTADQLAFAVATLSAAGTIVGDRLEHATVVPPGFAAQVAELGVAAVTHPGFIAAHGDRLLAEVDAHEQPWLHPCASLLAAGMTVAAASDAPFGPADPWRAIAAASSRRTDGGRLLGGAEAVSSRAALRLYLADPLDLRRVRRVAVGEPADLCVLRGPVSAALAAPSADWVRTTIAGGVPGAWND